MRSCVLAYRESHTRGWCFRYEHRHHVRCPPPPPPRHENQSPRMAKKKSLSLNYDPNPQRCLLVARALTLYSIWYLRLDSERDTSLETTKEKGVFSGPGSPITSATSAKEGRLDQQREAGKAKYSRVGPSLNTPTARTSIRACASKRKRSLHRVSLSVEAHKAVVPLQTRLALSPGRQCHR